MATTNAVILNSIFKLVFGFPIKDTGKNGNPKREFLLKAFQRALAENDYQLIKLISNRTSFYLRLDHELKWSNPALDENDRCSECGSFHIPKGRF